MKRALSAQKHVGLNVASDPLFTFAYMGVNAGMVAVTADDPGMHSSQNEQDNRNYAKFAKIPMFSPSDSQETYDMIKEAYDLSEDYDTMVLFHMTTRVCHSKSLVATSGERIEKAQVPYVRNLPKFDAVPAVSKQLRIKMVDKEKKLREYSENTKYNFIEYNDKKIGIVTNGVSYQYAKEVFGDNASYCKLGFINPLPIDKIRDFASNVDILYVIEELDPYIEEQLKANGIECIGKEKIPAIDELNPDIIAKNLLGLEREVIEYNKDLVVPRPPVLCAGCPHRPFFYELGKRKNTVVSGDIGCYGLSNSKPLNAKDYCICMGSSFSVGHGAAKVFEKYGDNKRVVGVNGDSTFFHTGINALTDMLYNKSNVISVILDNRTTGMTGHQENPGTGYTLQGEIAHVVDIEAVCIALGAKNIRTINPMILSEVNEALDWAYSIENEPVVIVTKWPCAIKKFTELDKAEFDLNQIPCEVDHEKCIGCKKCLKTGCPALSFDKTTKKVTIDQGQCNGCMVCAQVCPTEAISKKAGAK